jgi:hypothetical protein
MLPTVPLSEGVLGGSGPLARSQQTVPLKQLRARNDDSEAHAARSQTRPRAVTGRHHKSRKAIVLSFFHNHNLVCVVGRPCAYAYSTQRLMDSS